MMKRVRIAMFASIVATGCAGLIGVPDLSYDETAGGTDGAALDGTTPGDGFDAGPVTTNDANTCGANLDTDLRNCGRCGHDCSGGQCAGGLCTLTPELPGATTLALSGSTLFIGLIGDPDTSNRQGVVSCPTSGCTTALVPPSQVTPTDAGSIEPYGLAVNDTSVFMTDYYNGGIWRVTRATHAFVHFPSTTALTHTYAAAIDSQNFYWTEDEDPGNVWYCDLATCATPKKISTSRLPTQLVVANDGRVVFHGNAEIITCATRDTCATTKTTLPVSRVLSNMAQDPRDSSLVFWSTVEFQETDKALVQSCTTNPGCTVATTIAEEVDPVVALGVRDKSVYWATLAYDKTKNEFDSTKGTIKTCTLGADGRCDATGVRTIATDQHSPSAIVVDDSSVYWSNDGHHGFVDGSGTVVKAPR